MINLHAVGSLERAMSIALLMAVNKFIFFVGPE
jgi:hypothetical protein